MPTIACYTQLDIGFCEQRSTSKLSDFNIYCIVYGFSMTLLSKLKTYEN